MSALRVAARCLICFSLCSASSRAQTTDNPSYRLVFQNRYVEVFDLDLPPEREAPIHDNLHDLIWISLDSGMVEVERGKGEKRQLQVDSGSVHLYRRHELESLVNRTPGPVHCVIVEMRTHRIGPGDCVCTSGVESAVCGCARAPRLPPFWALAMSELTLAGTTLEPGKSLEESASREDTLLIAITAVQLEHRATLVNTWPSGAFSFANIDLAPGGVEWLPQGQHHLHNVGDKAARFVTIEF